MPRSAIATGLVDYILPPEDIPAQLLSYVQQLFTMQTTRHVWVVQDAPTNQPPTVDAGLDIVTLAIAHR
jgi:hypothetical protein